MLRLDNKSIAEAKSLVNNFISIIEQNVRNEANIKVGFTLISINSKIMGSIENFEYILVYPFFGENYVNNYARHNYYSGKNETIYFEDFCCSVDVSFYKYVFDETWKHNNLVVFARNNERWEKSYNHSRLIKIKHEREVLIPEQKFEEWYAKGEFNYSDFTVEIDNPSMYFVPFPVPPLLFQINKKNTFLEEIR